MEKRGDINPAYTPAAVVQEKKSASCSKDREKIAALDADFKKSAAVAAKNILKGA